MVVGVVNIISSRLNSGSWSSSPPISLPPPRTNIHTLQDPVIFSGTVRSNLDPFQQAASDASIWEALTRAGMDGFVRDLEASVGVGVRGGGGMGAVRSNTHWLGGAGGRGYGFLCRLHVASVAPPSPSLS